MEDSIQEHGFKLQQSRFRLNLEGQGTFLTMITVGKWKKLLREYLSLKCFKERLYRHTSGKV